MKGEDCMKKFKLTILELRIKYYLKQSKKTMKFMREYIGDNDKFRKYGKLNCKYLIKILVLQDKRDQIEKGLN